MQHLDALHAPQQVSAKVIYRGFCLCSTLRLRVRFAVIAPLMANKEANRELNGDSRALLVGGYAERELGGARVDRAVEPRVRIHRHAQPSIFCEKPKGAREEWAKARFEQKNECIRQHWVRVGTAAKCTFHMDGFGDILQGAQEAFDAHLRDRYKHGHPAPAPHSETTHTHEKNEKKTLKCRPLWEDFKRIIMKAFPIITRCRRSNGRRVAARDKARRGEARRRRGSEEGDRSRARRTLVVQQRFFKTATARRMGTTADLPVYLSICIAVMLIVTAFVLRYFADPSTPKGKSTFIPLAHSLTRSLAGLSLSLAQTLRCFTSLSSPHIACSGAAVDLRGMDVHVQHMPFFTNRPHPQHGSKLVRATLSSLVFFFSCFITFLCAIVEHMYTPIMNVHVHVLTRCFHSCSVPNRSCPNSKADHDMAGALLDLLRPHVVRDPNGTR